MRKPIPTKSRRVASERSSLQAAAVKGAPVRERRYSAPALEKGLEIIEIVSASPGSIKTEEIARAAGRSRSEIYRMLQVLEAHGYIARQQTGDGYSATSKLFTLGMRRTPIANLHFAALPEMRLLAHQLGQSVNLVVPSEDQIIYIAKVENPQSFSLSVPLGFCRQIVLSNSGRVLFGFQPPERQLELIEQLRRSAPAGTDMQKFVTDAERARRDGWLIAKSVIVEGATDICAPVWTANSLGCVATLVVPMIRIAGQTYRPEDAARATRAAADRITNILRPHGGPP